jgi:hypothetical protein
LALDLDSTTVVEYRELDRPLASLIDELETPEPTIEEIKRRVMVSRKKISVAPTKLLEWNQQFFRNLGAFFPHEIAGIRMVYKSHSAELVPDAEVVEFLYQTAETHLHGRVAEPTGEALIKWTSVLRAEISGLQPSTKN